MLGPILFLILINDLANISDSLFSLLFADDTTFQLTSNNINDIFTQANVELEKAAEWFKVNKLTINVSKTKYILFRKPTQKVNFTNLRLGINGQNIERIGNDCKIKSFKFVGIHLDMSTCNGMQTYSISVVIYHLQTLHFPTNIKKNVYNSLFKSHLEYGLPCWGGVKHSKLKAINILQKKSIRNIAGKHFREHTNPIYKSLGFLKVQDLIEYQSSCFMYKYFNNKCPSSFENFFIPFRGENRTKSFILEVPLKKSMEHFPTYCLPKTWNSLNISHKNAESLRIFKDNLKDHSVLNILNKAIKNLKN